MSIKKLWVTASILLLALISIGITRAQNVHASDPDYAKHSLAINLLRAINTEEVSYLHEHNEYASWDALVSNSKFAANTMKWAAMNDPQLAGIHLSSGPEILPGWRLRLILSSNGKQYDVQLEDMIDRKCGYAAITDERGIIRQSKAIDCPI